MPPQARDNLHHHSDHHHNDQTLERLSEPLLQKDDVETTSSSSSRSSSPDTPTPTPTTCCCSDTSSSASSSSFVSRNNIKLSLYYTVFAFAGRSVWSQSVLATFVYLLRNNSAEAVGYITAVMGVAQLLTSFPAGVISDSYRRDTILKVSAGIGVMAVMATVVACWYSNYVYLIVALATWGGYWGTSSTALTALFADSLPEHERTYYFSLRSILVTLGTTAGPLIALTLFAVLGNEWTLQECAVVMCVGQAVCFPALVILCFFRDEEDSSSAESESLHQPLLDQSKHENNNQEGSTLQDDEECLLLPEEDPLGKNLAEEEEDNHAKVACRFLPRNRKIPILVSISDVVTGLGSGMSIRYFPIFFVDSLKLDPVMVQVIFLVSPLLQALLTEVSQRLSVRYGRCQTSVAFKWIGTFCMFAMIATYLMGLPTWLVCVVYMFRTAFMNSTSALTRSVLMDHVPREERGKWSALESVNMFSWSGSAAIGGILVHITGIIPMFAITACIQFLSTIALMAVVNIDDGRLIQQQQQEEAEEIDCP